jgi:hypothetical protein
MSRLFLAALEDASSANANALTYDANRIDHVFRGHFCFRGGEILTEGGEGTSFPRSANAVGTGQISVPSFQFPTLKGR